MKLPKEEAKAVYAWLDYQCNEQFSETDYENLPAWVFGKERDNMLAAAHVLFQLIEAEKKRTV